MDKKYLLIPTLLATALLFLGCFHKTQTKQNKNQNTNIQPTPSLSPTPEDKEVIESNIDTSNWKTYRNEEYGFQVKYPEGWGNLNESVSPKLRPLTVQIFPPRQTEARVIIEKMEIYASYRKVPFWTKERILAFKEYEPSNVKEVILTEEKIYKNVTIYKTLTITSDGYIIKGISSYNGISEITISIYIPPSKVKEIIYNTILDSFRFL